MMRRRFLPCHVELVEASLRNQTSHSERNRQKRLSQLFRGILRFVQDDTQGRVTSAEEALGFFEECLELRIGVIAGNGGELI